MGLGVLLVLVVFYLITSNTKIIQEAPILDFMSGGGLRLDDFHYVQNNPEKGMTWILDAKQANTSSDGNVIQFDTFHLTLRTSEDLSTFELSGEQGHYTRDIGAIILNGQLEGISGQGYSFYTDALEINEKQGVIRTNKEIRIFGPLFSVKGWGLLLELEQETAKILSNVTAVINGDS